MTSDSPHPQSPQQPPVPPVTSAPSASSISSPSDAQGAPQGTEQSAQWAWVRPVRQVQWEETPPLEFHQLMRGAPRYRWWKPLVALVLAILYYLTLSVVFTLIILVPYFIFTGASVSPDDLFALAMLDTQQPISVVLALGSIALMIPAAILAMVSVGLTPAKRLWSVALRIRWRWIGRTVLPAFVALIVMNVLGIALEIAFAGGVDGLEEAAEAPDIDVQLALLSMLFVLLLVPLQSTAEELVYRGMFMQVLGSWLGGVRGSTGAAKFLRGPWIPVALPALLFGFSHIYDIWGFLMVTGMALVAGWISWRTGGLEAAISLHVVNNLVAFAFMAMAFGGETGQTADGGGPGSLIGSLAGLVLFAWWVDRDFAKRDGRRTRIDTVEARAPLTPSVRA